MPAARSWNEQRRNVSLLASGSPVHFCGKAGFSHCEQGIDVGDQMNRVPLDLIGSAPVVFQARSLQSVRGTLDRFFASLPADPFT